MRKRALPRSDGVAARLGRWVDELPAWARPPAFGALLIVLVLGARGVFVLAPVLVAAVLLTSHTPGRDLAVLAAIVGLAVLGAAAGGLAYSLVGRWLRRVPVIGPYVAGPVTVAPYMGAAVLVDRLTGGQPAWAPLDGGERVAYCACTLLFGLILGRLFARAAAQDAAAASSSDQAA